MNKKEINFHQQRNFGQILNGTFKFTTHEFKALFKVLLIYAGPFLLTQSIISAYFQNYVFNLESSMSNYDPYMYSSNPFSFFGEFINYYLLLLVFSVLGYTMLMSVTYSYISLYVENGRGNFTSQDIWHKTSHNFLKVFGANLLIGIMVGVGFIFCIAPGIYLFTSLSLIYIIMIYEKKGFGEAFSRSFEMTRVQFWWTLLIIIVMFAITGVISMIFSIPNLILTFTTTLMGASEVSESMHITSLIVNVITTFINSFINVVPMIALSFQYFNILELKESPSLLKKIDAISETEE